MATADVTVMGAGIFGLSLACQLLMRGASVQVLERARIGAGSSGGLVGALAPHTPENWNPKKQFQLESLLMAEDFWTAVHHAGGQDPLYARTGRLTPLADEAANAQARRRVEGARTLWQGKALWQVTTAPTDWAGESPTGLWVHDTLSARLAPRAALAALVAAIRAMGGKITEGAATPPEGLTVWATGAPGLAALSSDLGAPVGTGVKGQAALLACDAAHLPQLFVDGLHIVPHGNGTVAIGSTSENDWTEDTSTDARLEGLIDKARAACPILADAPVIDRWAGIRPRARSRAPMLGPWPDRPGQFILNGGFKIGFGMAPKLAEVMADLLLDGRDGIPKGFRVEDNL